MANKKTKGFTLLEIMVVIVILGLLASLTIPSLMSNKNRADQQKAVSDISALENALDMYRLDNGDYPTEQQGIAALVTKPNVPHYRRDIHPMVISGVYQQIHGEFLPNE